MLYVQIGFIIVLYIKSLFSVDSCDFLPSSQYNSFTLSSICFLFITTWSLQLSLWSKCMLRYFVTAAIGISTLLIVTGGHRPFLSVKVAWTDFVSFIFILHFLSQSWVRFKWSCKCCAAVRGSACDAKMAVSSAKVPLT